jgi:nicotinic acid mononucleotide adenylyltransferase
MKIAVLFGSFNPMTKAHISAMKTAVTAIGADKGLFVPTNGQY